jgi:hypothetical protein
MITMNKIFMYTLMIKKSLHAEQKLNETLI